MATKLAGPISRETPLRSGKGAVVVTLAPVPGKADAFVELRVKGRRTRYLATLGDFFRCMALWHGQAEQNARKAARRLGIPWRMARKAFIEGRRIPPFPKRQRKNKEQT